MNYSNVSKNCSSEEKSWTIYPTWGVNSHYYRGQYQLAYFKGTSRKLKVSDSKIITKLGLKFITPFAKEDYDWQDISCYQSMTEFVINMRIQTIYHFVILFLLNIVHRCYQIIGGELTDISKFLWNNCAVSPIVVFYFLQKSGHSLHQFN